MTRKPAPKKPRTNIVRSAKETGRTVGYTLLATGFILLSPVLHVYVFARNVRDSLAKRREMRAHKRNKRVNKTTQES